MCCQLLCGQESDTSLDKNILGMLVEPEAYRDGDGHNFVDCKNDSISGSVSDDDKKPLTGLEIVENSAGIAATMLTDSEGLLYELMALDSPYKATSANLIGNKKNDISVGNTSQQ